MRPSTRTITMIIAAAAVAALALILLRPESDTVPDEPTAPAELEDSAIPAPGEPGDGEPAERRRPAEPTAELRFEDGEVVGGVTDIEVSRGDRVRIDVRSDVEEEIHVHGYDIYADIAAGETARVAFTANIDGRFEIELHESHQAIAMLTVNP